MALIMPLSGTILGSLGFIVINRYTKAEVSNFIRYEDTKGGSM